ncbi:MAG TPA: 50S ribosomal protein L25 [Ktedonobacterales bacterium]
MANEIKLRVQRREVTGKHTRKLRAEGLTPGNISGGGKPSVAIQMNQKDLLALIRQRGTPILRISVDPGGGSDTALLAKVERDAVSAAILHVDFRRVKLTDPIKARVPLHTRGDAPAVKVYNGILLHLMESIEVEALPANLPDALYIDISGLTELNSTLTAKEIEAPAKAQLLIAPDEPVITVKAPRIEVEEAPAAAEQPAAAAEAASGAAPTEAGGGEPAEE